MSKILSSKQAIELRCDRLLDLIDKNIKDLDLNSRLTVNIAAIQRECETLDRNCIS